MTVMAMTLRLDDEETAALRAKAAEEGRSMQEVARQAIRSYVLDDPARFRAMVTSVIERDAELLARLAR